MSPPLVASTMTFIEIALIIFFVVFLLIVVAVMLARPGRYDEAARIPLDDDGVRTPRDEPHARNGGRPAAADKDGGAA